MTRGRTVIVGGGIAGLAAARALARDGRAVVLIERTRTWRPAGAALTLARNAMAVLDDVGAGDAVRAVGRRIDGAVIAEADGAPLGEVGEGWPELYAVRRTDLHDCLVDGLPEGVEVRLGTTVDRLTDAADHVTCHLSDGEAITCELVVGADGVGSQVRSLVLGAAAPAVRYAGYTCWRLLTTLADPPVTAVEQWGRGQRVGVVPLPDAQVYVFLTANAPPGGTDAGDAHELRRRFHAFGGPARRALAAIDERTAILRNDIVELDGVAFGAGRVALVGDAAHAMTPNLGQGAGQALEDVAALTRTLATMPPGRSQRTRGSDVRG
jgi:2-polyprenyl-6-methoxyphenol hydroxylase-like FAD-dependent oxidoreductase